MRPALAPAQRLLDGDEGPLLIDDMAGRRALVDVLERERPPAERYIAPEFPDDVIQPRRGQVGPRSVIFVENLDRRCIGHACSSLSIKYPAAIGPLGERRQILAEAAIKMKSPWRFGSD